MAHIWVPSLRSQRQVDQKVQAYKVSYRTTRATEKNLVSKENKRK